MKKTTIFFPNNLDASYLRYIFNILIRDQITNSTLVIMTKTPLKKIDFEQLPIIQKFHTYYICAIARAMSKKYLTEPTFNFDIRIESYQVKKNRFRIRTLLDIYQIFGKKIYDTVRASLSISYTFTEDKNFKLNFILRRKSNQLINDYISAQQIAHNYIAEGRDNEVFFINGRHPNQAAIRDYCEKNSIKFKSIEHGEPINERMHFEKYQIQELDLVQRKIMNKIDKTSVNDDLKKTEFARKWLENQEKNITQNPFISNFSSKNEWNKQKIITIFTSSVDENINNLGELTNGWYSQNDAILTTSLFLRQFGYSIIVRIHPNAINKSYYDVKKLLNLLIKFRINYILPWSSISSYDLINQSELIGTWASTIGLEAIHKGKKVFVLGDSNYDLLVPVKKISPSSLREIIEWKDMNLDLGKINQAIYSMMNYGDSIEIETFETFILESSRKIKIIMYVDSILNYYNNWLKRYFILRYPFLKGRFASIAQIEAGVEYYFSYKIRSFRDFLLEKRYKDYL